MGTSITVWHYVDLKVATLKSEGRHVTAKHYKAVKNSLRRFQNNPSLTFDQITEAFVLEYNQFLEDNSYQITTISFYNRAFRSIYNQAVRDGLLRNSHPFDMVYTGAGTSDSKKNTAKPLNPRPLSEMTREEILSEYNTLQNRYNSLVSQLSMIVGN